jgi:glucose/arabinose dehydrogenase
MLRAVPVADVDRVVAVLRQVRVVLPVAVLAEVVLAQERPAAVLRPVQLVLRVAVLAAAAALPAVVSAVALPVVEDAAPVVREADRLLLRPIWRNSQPRSMLRPVSTWRLTGPFSERPRRLAQLPAFQPGPGTLAQPFGLAFANGYLYVGNTASIVRYKYTNGDMMAQGEPEKIADLPPGGNHTTRNILFNRAGTKMYVAVGSASNNSAGEDCRRAAVLEFNPDGTGMRVYGSGIRNPVGLALQPGTDIVWTAINERDQLGDDLVPDYATSVKDGGFYGWPYSYIGKNPDPRYVGAFPELVNRAIVPDVLIPAHSAALGITFYEGTQFPQRYRNGGFVALHGSWNRAVAAGYRVIFFPMNNGRPGPIEDFASGFLSSDGTSGTPITAWGRPVGVTVARDGALLISDDTGNKIWKVSAAAPAAGGARRGN